MTYLTLFVRCFLLILALASAWTLWTSTHLQHDISPSSNKPDGFMTQVEMTQFDLSGNIDYTLSSPKLTHLPSHNTTLITHPLFTVFMNNDSPPWTIASDSGRATDGIETVKLWDNVVLSQPLAQHSTETTEVTTSEAYYYPSQQLATTTQDVTMSQPGLNIDATGLNVDFKTGEANLLSKVKGNYDPNKHLN